MKIKIFNPTKISIHLQTLSLLLLHLFSQGFPVDPLAIEIKHIIVVLVHDFPQMLEKI